MWDHSFGFCYLNLVYVYACRSLKLGHVTRRYGPDPAPTSIWFNGPFLSSLAYNNGFLGYVIIKNLLFLCLDRKELEQEKYPNTVSSCLVIPRIHLFMATALGR